MEKTSNLKQWFSIIIWTYRCQKAHEANMADSCEKCTDANKLGYCTESQKQNHHQVHKNNNVREDMEERSPPPLSLGI